MENHSDNPMHELDELKQQYKSFSQSLEGHQIINNNKVQYVVNNCRGHFQRHRRNVLIFYPLAMVLFSGSVLLVGGYASFAVLSALLLLVGMLAELWITADLSLSSNEIGLVEWAQRHYAAKRRFLLYYIVLICSLFYIIFLVGATLDVPNHLLDTVKIVIISLLVLSLVGFILLYMPVYRQCNELLRSANIEVDKSVGKNIGFLFLGILVLLSMAVTAVFKLMEWPGGTLLMLIAGVLIVAYAVVGAVRLRKRRHCPIILSVLLVLIAPIMTYLVMARINKWPWGGPDPFSHYIVEAKDGDVLNADIALVEVCSNYRPDLAAEVRSRLQQSGIASTLLPDSPALVAVCVADTAKANALLAECCPPQKGLAPCWSLPDTANQCLLFLVHTAPIVESHPGQSSIIHYGDLMCRLQQPYLLFLQLCSDAETAWQTAIFRFTQRQTPTTVAVVFDGTVICYGVVDRYNIGYQNLNFQLSANSTISYPLLNDMIQGTKLI